MSGLNSEFSVQNCYPVISWQIGHETKLNEMRKPVKAGKTWPHCSWAPVVQSSMLASWETRVKLLVWVLTRVSLSILENFASKTSSSPSKITPHQLGVQLLSSSMKSSSLVVSPSLRAFTYFLRPCTQAGGLYMQTASASGLSPHIKENTRCCTHL